jgi:predicted  nucleic acid-binding Zn-ribbon protein
LNSSTALLALQVADQDLASRRRSFHKVAQELKAQGGLPELRDRTEKSRARELEARVEHAKMESELATVKERLNHLEERLYSGAITNVRELQAVEGEHSSARKQYVALEQGLGPALAAAEDAKGRHEELRKELEGLEESWKATETGLASERHRLAKECSDMGKKRTQATTGIPENDLAFYESLLSRKAGVAVVRVERGVCLGCRVRLPLREISRMRGTTVLIACSSCGRILLAS